MEAGRDLDELIADKVMGLKREVRIRNTTFVATIYTDNPYFKDGVREEEIFQHYCQPLHYSTDIAAAWQVVEKLRHRQQASDDNNFAWPFDLCWMDDKGLWSCSFYNEKGYGIEECAATAPLSICLAALHATSLGE